MKFNPAIELHFNRTQSNSVRGLSSIEFGNRMQKIEQSNVRFVLLIFVKSITSSWRLQLLQYSIPGSVAHFFQKRRNSEMPRGLLARFLKMHNKRLSGLPQITLEDKLRPCCQEQSEVDREPGKISERNYSSSKESTEGQESLLRNYSRRENLKFENIMEEEDKENTEAILRGFQETEMGYKDANTVEIQRVHRLGRKQQQEGGILSLGSRLCGSNFKMYQDLPYEILARRRKQMDTFRKARQNNIPASFSKAQPDKLFICGKLWAAGKVLEL